MRACVRFGFGAVLEMTDEVWAGEAEGKEEEGGRDCILPPTVSFYTTIGSLRCVYATVKDGRQGTIYDGSLGHWGPVRGLCGSTFWLSIFLLGWKFTYAHKGDKSGKRATTTRSSKHHKSMRMPFVYNRCTMRKTTGRGYTVRFC